MTEKPPKHGWGPEWGKQFQSIGTRMTQESLKGAAQTGLGQLGKIWAPAGEFQKALGLAKADGSSEARALWVKLAGAGLPGLKDATGAGAIPGTGRVFGGGSSGGPIFSLLGKLLGFGGSAGPGASASASTAGTINPLDFGGFMAGGGDLDPSKAYITGENGPEIVAGVRARVFSNRDSMQMGGRGGDTYNFNTDARGADLGAENRLRRALEMTHRSAVAHAVQAIHERQKRVPRGAR
jgi:hypothetical protein